MSIWYENEPLHKENTNCPICGKSLNEYVIQLVGVGLFMNIFLCSDKCEKEFVRQIWKLAHQNDNNVLNENTKGLQQDIPIRLYIKGSYLCDKLSINEWNALFSRYENDSCSKIINKIENDKQGQDYAIIETTLFNVISKGAVLDLKFIASVKIGDKWVEECLH